ncbi:hypothetical protein CCL24_25900 [Pseudomonas congelans]|nr:hypothetical protein CCL24_25900 [Pseudomonas congelans]
MVCKQTGKGSTQAGTTAGVRMDALGAKTAAFSLAWFTTAVPQGRAWMYGLIRPMRGKVPHELA